MFISDVVQITILPFKWNCQAAAHLRVGVWIDVRLMQLKYVECLQQKITEYRFNTYFLERIQSSLKTLFFFVEKCEIFMLNSYKLQLTLKWLFTHKQNRDI